jgi:hypothetical protein
MCEPTESDDVMNVAAPPAPTVPVPKVVAPSKNVTVPVIVPAVAELTVAVNVTLAPVVDGLRDDAMAAVVDAFVPAFTVCVSAGEVLAAKFVLPPYCAVMECDPCVSAEVENVAFPPAPTAPAPRDVAPSRNVAVPVIVPAVVDETVAVNVTLAPVVDGLSDDATAVVVDAVVPALTVCVIAGEVLGA